MKKVPIEKTGLKNNKLIINVKVIIINWYVVNKQNNINDLIAKILLYEMDRPVKNKEYRVILILNESPNT
ncbi:MULTISPECIES: hypothetical protein [Bacillus]|uniref:hypothetical protein n=1 Tax=Bacillus TaxID=1386 RepID=UPI0012F7D442|nr:MULTISPECIES: hypothetical protein [Bacillus]BCD31797.1 hypothetical protein BC30102_4833 [Bacillus cereus]HDX9574117.1 hypothetical protein [Bacillus mobilis]